MADYAKQAPTRPAPAFLSQPLSVEPTVVDLTAEEPVSTAHNTGKLTGAAPLQNATPKPVFRMKRTGHANLPPGINTPTRDGSTPLSPATYTPTPPAATLVVLDSEPEPAKIVSDILPPTHPPPTTPMLDSISAPSIPNPSPASDGTRKTKYATDEERRKATSLALKQRWASGIMDNVHKKRVETMKKRREAALLGTPGVTKPLGPVSSVKGVQKTPGSPSRLPNPSLATNSNHHVRTKSLVFEQLARYLDDKPASAVLATQLNGQGVEKQESVSRTSSATSDIEMPNIEPVNYPGDSIDSEWEEDSLSPGHSRPEEEGYSGEVTGDVPKSIERTASGRPYTKVADQTGSLVMTYGALMPEGYQLSTTTPQHPWACPVRSCHKPFPQLIRLGGHFVRAHRGVLLHDNEDGTFSVRGVYAPLRREGSQVSSPRQPAVVVSQGPTDFSDPSEMIPPWEANDDESGPTSATPDEKDPQVLDRGLEMGAGLTGEALWSYLQPHLVKHKGPDVPSKGWVRELLPLHQIREPDWNTIWLADHPFCDSQPRDVSALIIQVTGDLAPTPCARCREGKGPFASCVMISTKAHSDPLKTIFGCSNCFYHYRQTYCTNKEWGATRAKEILQGRRGHSRPKVKPPASEEGIRGDDKLEQEVKIQDMSTIDDDNMEHYMNDSTADTPPTSGSAPTSIREAEPGRPYTMWPDDTGCLATMSGALLPIGYQLDRTIPRRPWVCPVRTCRKAFGKRSDLGFHFPRVHFAAQLNDNGDGTFSIRGIYQSKPSFRQQNGKTVLKAPPIVISKEPLSGNSPPPKPELPVYLAPKFSLGGAGARKVAQLQEKTPNEQARSWTGDSTRGDLRTRGAPSRAEEMEVDDSEGSKAADALGNSRRLRAARRPEVKTQASSSRQPLPSSLISPGTFHPGDLLEMEDWEVAPGRIRESAAADSGPIAFSKAYLSAANHAVPVCDDVAFRVDTIASGSTLRLEADMNITRLCSVAAGKVRVKIGEEAEFVVGPHGMFKVKAGVVGSVRNGLYLDAVLHVVVLQGFN